jgi:hypothetical protein
MRNYLLLLLVLSLPLAGCPDDAPNDADMFDTPLADAPAALDVPATMDAPSADDAPVATDAPVADDAPTDTPATVDTRVVPPGECADTEPCPPTCLIATSCVTECGGPVTNCGCCPCAEGSINVGTCTATD